jgi:MFS family permease
VLLVTSIVVGRAITNTGRYRIFPILGGALMVVGMLLLAQLDVHTSKTTSALYMVVLGLGMGCLMQTTMLIAQNSVEVRDLGVASSAAAFFRSIGGSFGVSLFGAVFAHRLTAEVSSRLGPEVAARLNGGGGDGGRLDPATLKTLPAPVRDGFLHGVATGIGTVFWWAVPIAILVPVLAWFIVEIPLRGRPDEAPSPDADAALAAGTLPELRDSDKIRA